MLIPTEISLMPYPYLPHRFYLLGLYVDLSQSFP